MPNDGRQPKVRSVRTRPANVIRAIVLGAAAATAPTACDEAVEAYAAPMPDVTAEDAAGDVARDEATDDEATADEGVGPDAIPPYGVPDGVEYGVPDPDAGGK